MTKNRITAIYFDPDSFPMPPAYTAYTAIEGDDTITFIGMEKESYLDDNITIFDGEEIAHAPSLPAGDYYLRAHTLEGADRYKIEFFMIAEKTGEIVSQHILDNKQHVLSFSRAFDNAVSKGDVDFGTFETEFSKKYLSQVFKSIIEGNDAFWKRFHDDLDVATTPLNLNMLREERGEAALPITFKSPHKKLTLN